MSARTLTVITCDGPKVGASTTCTIAVDLCPTCSPHAVLAPHRCGRPRKKDR